MNKKKIKGFFKGFGKKEEIPDEKVIENQYQKNLRDPEVTRPLERTASNVTELMKAEDTDATQVLSAAIDSNTPDRLLIKIADQIANDEKIPNGVIARAINYSGTDVADKNIIEILRNIPFKNQEDKEILIKNITDKGLQEEQILYFLNQYYESIGEKTSENSTIDNLKSIYENLDFNSEQIDNMTRKIAARQMACMYHNFSGAIMPQKYKKLPPTSLKKMIEYDMPAQVLSEHSKLFPLEKMDISDIRRSILRELAEDVAIVYNKTKIFSVPQSNNMKNLPSEDAKFFIEEIMKKANVPENEKAGCIVDIQNQINANYDEDKKSQRELEAKLSLLPKGDKIRMLKIFNEMMDSERFGQVVDEFYKDPNGTLDVLTKLANTGALCELKKIPPKERRLVFETINSTIEKRINNSINIEKNDKTQDDNIDM